MVAPPPDGNAAGPAPGPAPARPSGAGPSPRPRPLTTSLGSRHEGSGLDQRASEVVPGPSLPATRAQGSSAKNMNCESPAGRTSIPRLRCRASEASFPGHTSTQGVSPRASWTPIIAASSAEPTPRRL